MLYLTIYMLDEGYYTRKLQYLHRAIDTSVFSGAGH